MKKATRCARKSTATLSSRNDQSDFDVVCIRWGQKYSFDYVTKLHDQVMAATTKNIRFICFTDQPERAPGIDFRPCFDGLQGWYQKLGLFKRGALERPTLFLDLDVIVTGTLDRLLEWPWPFGISRDFIWHGFNSSVMFLTPDICPALHDDYVAAPYIHRKGDQGIIEEYLRDAVTFPGHWCLSYKVDQVKSKPECAIVIFHGDPKPPDCNDAWIKDFWP